MLEPVSRDRFHGRVESRGQTCQWPACEEAGEFRAPGAYSPSFDGPGHYRWFCLDHVRQFNAGYDFFDGMSAEEIFRAQSPISGWERETRAFRPTAGVDGAPDWANFVDPLETISQRARGFRRQAEQAARPQQRHDGRPVTREELRALDVLGLSVESDSRSVRRRYTEMLRLYHPDHNGGDRKHEARLQSVVDAYQLLRKAATFR